MRCSNCSEEVRPVVAIDIDGTLGNYHQAIVDFAQGWLGRFGLAEPYRGDEPYHAWFTRTFEVDRTTFRAIKLAFRQGGMKRTMAAYLGARDLVGELGEAGAEVWLTTTRPHDRFDRVDPDTREWLRRNDIGFSGLLYSGDKMKELALRIDPVRVVAVLDDQLDVMEDASAFFGAGVPILRKTRFNREVRWPVEVTNLADAGDLIQQRLTAWKEYHERPVQHH